MADEQDEKVSEADGNGEERETERSAEELGEELLARLDKIDAELAALKAGGGTYHERISALEVAGTGYAPAGHEHEYAKPEHEHEHEHKEGGMAEGKAPEKPPRASHWWYRKRGE